MGYNGAGQAILDAASMATNLAQHSDPTGTPGLRNRQGGPKESSTPAELEAIVTSYTQAARSSRQ
jgi:hypothetical protein